MDMVVQRFDIYTVRFATLSERILEIDLPYFIRPYFIRKEKDPASSSSPPGYQARNHLISAILPADINAPKKVQLCVVVSPDEINRHLHYVIVAPMTAKARPYPTRAACQFEGKDGFILLDQIRAVDKRYLEKKVGKVSEAEAQQVLAVLGEMFSE